LDARPHVGPAVHLHQAIRAVAGDAEQAAWPVVLEAAREDAYPRRVQGGADTLAVQGGDFAPLERERQRMTRVGQATGGQRRQVVHGASPSSGAVCNTEFVRTSRSAMSQRRQPKR